jgi:hypothetical protein
LLISACGGATTSAPTTSQEPGESQPAPSDGQIGGQLNVWTAWGGTELSGFQAVLQPFIDSTGIQVNLLTIRDQDLQLSNNVAAGTSLPDIANPPNPQRYEEWATQGIMKPLEDFIDMDAYLANTLPGLLLEDKNYGFIGDKHYLLMVKSQLKGLVWYNPRVYTGDAPETWDDMLAVETPSSDTKLFCATFESGDASGWPASDDVANIVMRQAGAEVYVDWYEGRVKWTDPAIKTAYETFGHGRQRQRLRRDGLRPVDVLRQCRRRPLPRPARLPVHGAGDVHPELLRAERSEPEGPGRHGLQLLPAPEVQRRARGQRRGLLRHVRDVQRHAPGASPDAVHGD